MLGLTFGLDTVTREMLAYATFGVSALLMFVAAWRHTPDGLAKPAALGAIGCGVLTVNFFVTLAAGGSSLDFERIARAVVEGSSRRAVARSGPGQQGGNEASIDQQAAGSAGGAASSDGGGGVVGRMLGAVTSLAHAATVRPEESAFKDCPHCPEMRVIAPGFFEMGAEGIGGSPALAQGLRVRIARRYAISAGVIRGAEWQAFATRNGRAMPRCGEGGVVAAGEAGGAAGRATPVACLTQHDAVAYVAWLSRETGRRYRLASEAEWEHAARAGSQRRYWSGLVAPLAVDGVVPANPNGLFGLHDRFGERVADCWSAALQADVTDGSAFAPAGCTAAVVKDLDASGARASAAARLPLAHDARDPRVGLRVVREME